MFNIQTLYKHALLPPVPKVTKTEIIISRLAGRSREIQTLLTTSNNGCSCGAQLSQEYPSLNNLKDSSSGRGVGGERERQTGPKQAELTQKSLVNRNREGQGILSDEIHKVPP